MAAWKFFVSFAAVAFTNIASASAESTELLGLAVGLSVVTVSTTVRRRHGGSVFRVQPVAVRRLLKTVADRP